MGCMGQAKQRGTFEQRKAQSQTSLASALLSGMDAALASAPEKLACAQGCSYCCHYHVYVYPHEVFALADYIRTLAEDAQGQIRRALLANVERIESMSVDEHIATNIACALLQNGLCSAYSVRPSACRQHHSLDGVSCKVTFYDTASPMQNIISAQRMANSARYILQMTRKLRASGYDITRYEMNRALLEALSDPGCRDRWNQGQKTFITVVDTTTEI